MIFISIIDCAQYLVARFFLNFWMINRMGYISLFTLGFNEGEIEL